ncbi:MAG: mycothiol synthase [Pseudonocardiaceae bacterium]|nr:mycothiol synthase [Pseudonocardiaceae bacterium]
MLNALNAAWNSELTPDELERVRELLLDARHTDGWPEVPADGPLPGEFRGGLHLLASKPEDRSGALAGYAHLDTAGDAFGRQVAELVIRPALRRGGLGTAVLEAVLERAELPAGPGDRLRVWSHGDHPGAARLAGRFGFTRARELLRMRLDFEKAPPLPELASPEGVRIDRFRPGVDEPEVIAVNAKAFDWHPEQGALTVEDLRATEKEDWFDPNGFFLARARLSGSAEKPSNTAGERVVGFHWTKVHPAGEDTDEPVGEVYVVGVDPDAQGGGLGKVLTLAGLRYLAEAGLRQVILYVEGDNQPAIAVYRRLGFEQWDIGVQYAR